MRLLERERDMFMDEPSRWEGRVALLHCFLIHLDTPPFLPFHPQQKRGNVSRNYICSGIVSSRCHKKWSSVPGFVLFPRMLCFRIDQGRSRASDVAVCQLFGYFISDNNKVLPTWPGWGWNARADASHVGYSTTIVWLLLCST